MQRVAVITPYHREPLGILAQCHQSVLTQEVPADHFMVADGFPSAEVAAWNVRHVTLPDANGPGGSVPRGIGSMIADSQRYDFVAYLDADNWWQPTHLSSLLELHRSTGALVCTSLRTFHAPDGTQLAISEGDEDALRHVDTSCMLLHRRAFELLPIWFQMPPILGVICDRVFLAGIRKHRVPIASTRQRTVAYRTLYEAHYQHLGLPLPPGAKGSDVLKAGKWMESREGVNTCFHRLGFWPMTYL